MISFPNAKINIGLHVVGKRPDGYHDIETVFYPVNLQDALEVTLMKPLDSGELRRRISAGKLVRPEETPLLSRMRRKADDLPCCSLEMTGLDIEGPAQDNLVVKAYLMLAHDFDLPAIDIRLHKHIPTGAGMGGGSSDGASMISLLNRRFGLRMKDGLMEQYAARLGSDCAFFIQNTPVIATGRGEIMNPVNLNLHGWYIVLVKPDVHISTAMAYAGVVPQEPPLPLQEAVRRPVTQWRDIIVNDFEQSVFKQYPVLSEIKEKLYAMGAGYASMTGSGATVYGLFKKPADNPAATFPGMFCAQRELL